MGLWDVIEDIGEGVVDVVTAPVKIIVDGVTLPYQAAYAALKGENVLSAVEQNLKRSVGNLNFVSHPINAFAATDTAQKALRNETLNKITLGYSSDWAATQESFDKLSDGKELNKEDYLGSGRFLLKSATIGGTQLALAKAGPMLAKAKDLAAVAAPVAGLAKGDPAALLDAAGLGDEARAFQDVNNYFNAPETPAAPVPVLGPPPSAPVGSGSAQVRESDPYAPTKGTVAYTVNQGAKTDSSQTMLLAGAALAAFILMGKR